MRGRYSRSSSLPDMKDRLIASGCYLIPYIGNVFNYIIPSIGWLLGMLTTVAIFIWLFTVYIPKSSFKHFIRFNLFQSIFISVLVVLISLIVSIVMNIIGFIPFIGIVIINLLFYLFVYPLIFGFSLFHSIVLFATLYLVIVSFSGKYGELPWISDMVRKILP